LLSGINSSTEYLIKIDNLSKSFPAEAGLKINVLQDITFNIPKSEKGIITTILAPFGSGKSTLLKIISEIIKPDSGEINFNETNKIIPLIPEKPSSFPWLNVKENIEFILNQHNENQDVNRIISLVGLSGYENHYPHNKSIGFRFRISLARALAVNPSLILIDDSFKMMKAESRGEIYDLLLNLSLNLKQNFIIATTNLIEAVRLSDKIILMSKKPGRIIKEFNLSGEDRLKIADHKSEIFTAIKSEIEAAFEAVDTLSTINYSL